MAKKKTKELSPEERLQEALVPEDEWPYPIPENWCWTKVKALCDLKNGRAFKPSEWSERGLPIIRIQNLNNPDYGFNCFEGVVEADYRLYGGELLFAWSGTPGTSFGAHIWWGKDAVLNQHIFRVDIDEDVIDKSYFKYAINQRLDRLISVAHGGAGLQHVTKGVFENTAIVFPPLNEQHRIVSRIESLFAKLDEAKEAAQAVMDGFEDRKAAILHKAFTGELTKEWREKHNRSLEEWVTKPWGDFLTRIEAGKNWNAEGRPPLNDEFGLVKVSAVTWGEFNEEESKTCFLEEQWNENVQIKSGDFLFSRANTLQLVGNCVIVKTIQKKLMLSDKILRFSFNDIVRQEYVLYFTRSMMYRHQIEELASGNQDGMRNISQKNVRLVIFPIPSLDEQGAIVKILHSFFDNEALARELAESVLDQIDAMKKSILARAFRGELGTNDPGDESAVELLKRVLSSG